MTDQEKLDAMISETEAADKLMACDDETLISCFGSAAEIRSAIKNTKDLQLEVISLLTDKMKNKGELQ